MTVLEVPYLIQTGELDIFLVRPLNVLFQFVIFQLDEESVLEALVALLLLIVSICQLPTLWTLTFFCEVSALYCIFNSCQVCSVFTIELYGFLVGIQ